MVKCSFKCRYYNRNSAMCKGETLLCATRRRVLHWFRRLEVIISQLDDLRKKEREDGGLNVNDNQSYDSLEKEQNQFEAYLKRVGVKLTARPR